MEGVVGFVNGSGLARSLSRTKGCSRRGEVSMRTSRPGPRGRRQPPEDKGFMESELVVREIQSIMKEHSDLIRLGATYGKFDKRGKLLFIQQWKNLMERYEIHLKRIELSDDFQAQLTIKQIEVSLENMGMNRNTMMDYMKSTLQKMEEDAERSPW
ncbi:hypothetical protein NDN08_001446 [Rhodosorus marinus]|uniref:Uncharacterized protein n=1 Tax=Rhodosorus marinus TaxID=101924 RepID=A0AAV8UTM2_9RHOD|nr:hypothetical protein NDN08_001446 [Rhodosorus marinus]